MNDHRARQIFNCEHEAIKRVRETYRALYEPNAPKPPFPVAVHNVDALVPFEELDDYL
jgi:hypothetical protein